MTTRTIGKAISKTAISPVKRGTDLEESFLAILRMYRLPEP